MSVVRRLGNAMSSKPVLCLVAGVVLLSVAALDRVSKVLSGKPREGSFGN
jgi:hypothetical protein